MSATALNRVVLIGGSEQDGLALSAILDGWAEEFEQFASEDWLAATVFPESVGAILVAVDGSAEAALACCATLKDGPSTAGLPVAIVTKGMPDRALRLLSLRAGADDVFSLDDDDAVIGARTAALLRLKVLQDEVAPNQLGETGADEALHVLIFAEEASARKSLLQILQAVATTTATDNPQDVLFRAARVDHDLIIVHGGANADAAFRLCGQLRCVPANRFVPLLALFERDAWPLSERMSCRTADDCLIWPASSEELTLRVLLQARRKRFLTALERSVSEVVPSGQALDPETGLSDRVAFAHLLQRAQRYVQRVEEPLHLGLFQLSGMFDHASVERTVAAIRTHLAGRDVASRLDEGIFAVLMPDRKPQEAQALVEAMKQDMLQGFQSLKGRYFAGQAASRRHDLPVLDVRVVVKDIAQHKFTG
ncbi:hypothetical protein FJU08_14160 [Martelella alba]|uniref:GGDEF domain-containing protein n=1 Tax=Martelella alba TaxID=2590451 RepID=A0A506U524_9HYPH|nr:hypothetical protein [Martelella alba]TPW29473.1 hypothetical protein FJU08_14160 [Martelella alba]